MPSTVPGMIYPTQRAMLASNPRDSAIAQQNAADQKLSNMINKLSGGKRHRKGGAISVPQFQMSYTPQSGPGQDPNSIIKQNALVGTQSAANSVYDSYATKLGGYRRRNSRKINSRKINSRRRHGRKNKTRRNHKSRKLRGGCGNGTCPI
jgi:hypothetical protein